MDIEEAIANLREELKGIPLPDNTSMERLTDSTLTGNIAPLITHLAAAVVAELPEQDTSLFDLLGKLFSAFDSDTPAAKPPALPKGKESSSPQMIEQARQTYEWLSNTTPFAQILNLVKAMAFFSSAFFGDLNSAREKSNQQANRQNRPSIMTPEQLARQYYRQPQNQNQIRALLTLHGLPDQTIEAFLDIQKAYPGVQDLVMFAVREVFNPALVAKYRLSEDMPEDFIKEAELGGLDRYYAEMYWKAHWRLPSTQQAFEMLHRGAIDETELNDLLKANDIMPGQRENLLKIAYARFTRVDVRRVYQANIQDENWVFQKHKEMGYSPEDAEVLTTLVVEEYNAENKEFNTSQILNLFEQEFYSREVTKSELNAIGHPWEQAEILIQKKEIEIAVKLEKKLTGKIRSNFISGGLTELETTRQLSAIGASAENIQGMLKSWKIDKDATQKKFTTTQIKKFMLTGLMNVTETRNELVRLNWSEYRAELLIKFWLKQASEEEEDEFDIKELIEGEE
jgi:hypothetical protein